MRGKQFVKFGRQFLGQPAGRIAVPGQAVAAVARGSQCGGQPGGFALENPDLLGRGREVQLGRFQFKAQLFQVRVGIPGLFQPFNRRRHRRRVRVGGDLLPAPGVRSHCLGRGQPPAQVLLFPGAFGRFRIGPAVGVRSSSSRVARAAILSWLSKPSRWSEAPVGGLVVLLGGAAAALDRSAQRHAAGDPGQLLRFLDADVIVMRRDIVAPDPLAHRGVLGDQLGDQIVRVGFGLAVQRSTDIDDPQEAADVALVQVPGDGIHPVAGHQQR